MQVFFCSCIRSHYLIVVLYIYRHNLMNEFAKSAFEDKLELRSFMSKL